MINTYVCSSFELSILLRLCTFPLIVVWKFLVGMMFVKFGYWESSEPWWFSISLFGHSNMLYSWLQWHYPNANDFGSKIILESTKNLMFRSNIPSNEKWVSSIWQIKSNPQTFYNVVNSLIGYKLILLFWFRRHILVQSLLGIHWNHQVLWCKLGFWWLKLLSLMWFW